MANKMKVCNHCGNEIASSAKVCPHCGAKIKKPIYKRVWFWILAVLIVACIGGGIGGSKGSGGSGSAKKESAPEKKEEITYTAVTVEDVQCYIKNDDQMDIIKTMATGDEIVVKGKVTSVGEVIGYAMDIDELSAK